MAMVKGLGVSAGIVRGRALVLRQRARQLAYLVPESAIDAELARLDAARDRSRRQLEEIHARVARVAGNAPASLFEAQLLMVDDPTLIARAAELIKSERRNAEWALQEIADSLGAMFNDADDPYLRERKGDLHDVIGRLRMNMGGNVRVASSSSAGAPWIIVADQLPPSIAAQIDWQHSLGFITEAGSWTYHTAILARSLGVPAVVGVRDATRLIAPGADVILDGTTGEIFLDAPEATRQEVLRRRPRPDAQTSWQSQIVDEPVTPDGVRVRLDTNLEFPDEATDAIAAGAEGIGLFRSEFLLAGRANASMGEDEQTEIYRQLLSRVPGEVTVRTFDLTEVRTGQPPDSAHRFALRMLGIDPLVRAQFEAQVRALLRAASAGRLRILLPFVTGVDDVKMARTIVSTITADLRAAGEPVPDVPVGAMIEVPSAALTADRLVEEVDFLSVGTNDLVALVLALDRSGGPAAHLHDPLHPAVLRLLRVVRRAATRRRRRISVCGEMASDPALLVLLLGLGFVEFSMGPSALARARHLVRHISVEEARHAARQVVSRQPDAARLLLETLVHRVEETPEHAAHG